MRAKWPLTYITREREYRMNDLDDTMARTLKWKMRLEACEGVRTITWATTAFIEISERGLKSIEKKKKQVGINKEAIEGLAKWDGITERDREILRSFYRMYTAVYASMNDTIAYVKRILELKAKQAKSEQQRLEGVLK
jgi:hypothetical protein